MGTQWPDGRPPLQVPGYEIVDEIGRGGFAVVYLARQLGLHRTVALKVLTNVDADDQVSLRRFETECRAVGSLSWHPHVVTVHDVGRTTDGRSFLAMEHLPAGSLHGRLQRAGALAWRDALRAGVQIADALAAAHDAGILHRDVKPANVLTDRLGDHQLADFGIARLAGGDRTTTGAITGTIAYTAPEVLAGARFTVAADLYGLGALLHCLITGRCPFVGDDDESLVAVLFRASTEAAPSLVPAGAPAELDAVVGELLAKSPTERPATAIGVGHRLQGIQAAHGLAVTPLRFDQEGIAPAARAGAPPPPGPLRPPIDPDPPTVRQHRTTVAPSAAPSARIPPPPFRAPPAGVASASAPPAGGPEAVPPGLATPVPPATRRRRRVPALLVTLLVVASVATAMALLATRAGDDDASAGGTDEETSAEADPCSSPPTGDAAQAVLRQMIRDDRPRAEAMVGSWAPQLATQYHEPPSSFAAVLEGHCRLRSTHADVGVVLVPGSDYPRSMSREDAWVSIARARSATSDAALDWCEERGLDNARCFAKRLSDEGTPKANSAHRGDG